MYNIIQNVCIHRLIDNVIIPINNNNADYQEYLRWVDKGNVSGESNYIPIDETTLEKEQEIMFAMLNPISIIKQI